MQSIPIYIFLIAISLAWVGLMVSWLNYIREVTERRRIDAEAQGETPPDIKGTSNYERADLRKHAHRAMKITLREKWIGRVIFFGVPIIILTVFLTSASI